MEDVIQSSEGIIRTFKSESGAEIDVFADRCVIRLSRNGQVDSILGAQSELFKRLVEADKIDTDQIIGIQITVSNEFDTVYIKQIVVITVLNDILRYTQLVPDSFFVSEERHLQRVLAPQAPVIINHQKFLDLFGWLTENIYYLVPDLKDCLEHE